MKKLLLINPVGRRSGTLLSRFSTFPPLGLAYVAAVTPDEWEVKILDENFERFKYEDADLVGITAFSGNIRRAYEIADIYRQKKVKVVMGGIHASMLPDEALCYADSVVVGEVEGIWKSVLDDFCSDRLSAFYVGQQVDLANQTVIPRHDLFHPRYYWHSVQTSRGCPFACEFCSVSKYLGKNYRQRSAANVLSELKTIKGRHISFVDDNLIGHSPEHFHRAEELFRGMIREKMNKKWWMQTSINVVENEQLIALAAESGCSHVFIGFETIFEDLLKQMKKGINIKAGVHNYKNIIKMFHKHGIAVLGAFIVGNDNETSDYYKRLADFLITSDIDIVQITMLTPLPGTDLMDRLQKEKRLIYQDYPNDWDKYRFSYMVHNPIGITIDSVYAGSNYIKSRLYSFPTYQYRLIMSFLNLKGRNFPTVYKFNAGYKKGWLNSHYYKDYPK